MANKIYSVHDLAYCDGCDWQYDCFHDPSPSYHCQQHANKTGHKVHREIGRHIDYYPRDLKPI